MHSEYGTALKISIFGESHGRAIGVNIDGLPAGEKIDMEELTQFMSRRRPGEGPFVTGRKETDATVFLSGVNDDETTGFPVCAVIENNDARPSDYAEQGLKPRPAHADFTARVKYGSRADMRGGGHFSGRLTAPLCVAGGIAIQMLKRRGIGVGAHLLSVGRVQGEPFPIFPTFELFSDIFSRQIPTLCEKTEKMMVTEIETAAKDLDSVGGVIECAVIGVPAGLGGPMFGGVEGRLSQALFGVPGIKGVDFGAGFNGTFMRGSLHNDPFTALNGNVMTKTNNHGGILGGISSGMPILFRAAVKPTPSIGIKQKTVDLETMSSAEIEVKGRHDPCIALRAVPVIEAAAAVCILDILLEECLIWNSLR